LGRGPGQEERQAGGDLVTAELESTRVVWVGTADFDLVNEVGRLEQPGGCERGTLIEIVVRGRRLSSERAVGRPLLVSQRTAPGAAAEARRKLVEAGVVGRALRSTADHLRPGRCVAHRCTRGAQG